MKNQIVGTDPKNGQMVTSWDSVPQVVIDSLILACQQKAGENRAKGSGVYFHSGTHNLVPADGTSAIVQYIDETGLGISAEKRGATWTLVIEGAPTWAHFVVRASAERLRNDREAA